MTYFESAEGIKISKKRALLELKRHGVPKAEFPFFFNEMGDKEEYNATEVLIWLGY